MRILKKIILFCKRGGSGEEVVGENELDFSIDTNSLYLPLF